MASRKAFKKPLKNEALMSKSFMQNVPQSALSRMIIVAWLASSASKRILRTRFLCSKLWSRRLAMSASFCPSSTVNLIPLKWCVHCTYWATSIHWLNSICSIGDGLSIGNVKSTRTHSKIPKMLLKMLSTHVLLRWSGDSSTTRGDGCQRTTWDSQERPHSGLYASKKVIAVSQGLPWCIWMPFSIVLSLPLTICAFVATKPVQTWFLPHKFFQFWVPKYWPS